MSRDSFNSFLCCSLAFWLFVFFFCGSPVALFPRTRSRQTQMGIPTRQIIRTDIVMRTLLCCRIIISRQHAGGGHHTIIGTEQWMLVSLLGHPLAEPALLFGKLWAFSCYELVIDFKSLVQVLTATPSLSLQNRFHFGYD